MKKICALVLSLVLLLAAVPTFAVAEDYKEPITLNVYNALANFSGVQSGWFAHELKERFNVTLNYVRDLSNQGGFNAALASNEIGDIVVLGDLDNEFLKGFDADLLYDWSELDLTPYTNLNANLKDSMANITDYVKRVRDTDGVWGFTQNIALVPGTWQEMQDPTYAMQIRFDAWEKAGKPELNTLEDLPAFMKALQDAVPTNAAGEKVYAYGGFSDWEDCVMKFTWDLMTYYGYKEWDFLGVNYATQQVVNPLDEGSLYYRALKVNNQLYRAGLFDPESVSQNFDTYSQKLSNGRYLMTLWGWIINNFNSAERAADNIGYTTFVFGDGAPAMDTLSTNGGTWPYLIGANCKYPERVLEIFDWLASEEGAIVSNYGPQGLCWDYNAEGVPEMTEFGWKCQEDRKATEMPAEYGGGTFEDGENKFNNQIILLEQTVPGKTYTFSYKGWPCYIERYATNLSKAWSTEYANGAANGAQLYLQSGNVSIVPYVANSYVKTESSEDSKSARGLFAPVMKQYSWKCVYAESDEEFESLWNEMVSTCKSYGYDAVVAEKMVDIQKCFDLINASK